MTTFNPDPIMFRSPSFSLVMTEKHRQPSEELPIIEIAQHLAPEQYHYEFPPKSRIMAIEAEMDDHENDEFSFFDECSFTTTSSSSANAYSNMIQEEDEEEDDDDEDYYQQLMMMNHHSNRSSSDRLDRYFDSFTNDHNKFVADHQLSPLQLPSQISYHSSNSSNKSNNNNNNNNNNNMRSIREESCDSTGTMILANKQQEQATIKYSRPSSFLSTSNESITPAYYAQQLECVAEEDRIHWDEHAFIFPDHQSTNHAIHSQSQIFRSVHPYQEDTYLDDKTSHSSLSSHQNSRVIIMKISKTQPPTIIHHPYANNSFISTTDEGYDDELLESCATDDFNLMNHHHLKKEVAIESNSVFLPLSDGEQEQLMDLEHHRHLAAIKIQSLWRGYLSRCQIKSIPLRVMAGLARINDSIHCRNYNHLQQKCLQLEERIGEETAMRTAFEKAMEDMTILMDHQHKVLFDRVQQEVDMRQAYESKMNQVLVQVPNLEARLRHETKARADMENIMSRVLDQLHDVKALQKNQVDENKALQEKLEDAMKEISCLKKEQQQQKSSTPAITTTRPSTTQQQVSRLSNKSTRTTATTSSAAAPIKRTTTPSTINRATTATPSATATTTVRSSTVISRTPSSAVDSNKKATKTPSSLRKSVMNRKL